MENSWLKRTMTQDQEFKLLGCMKDVNNSVAVIGSICGKDCVCWVFCWDSRQWTSEMLTWFFLIGCKQEWSCSRGQCESTFEHCQRKLDAALWPTMFRAEGLISQWYLCKLWKGRGSARMEVSEKRHKPEIQKRELPEWIEYLCTSVVCGLRPEMNVEKTCDKLPALLFCMEDAADSEEGMIQSN